MAYDERVKAGVASSRRIAFSSQTGTTRGIWAWRYLRLRIFKLNHHQFIALVAPRPLLILAASPGRVPLIGDRSWPYIAEAQSGLPIDKGRVRLGLLNHHKGHSIPDDVYAKLQEWLQVYTST